MAIGGGMAHIDMTRSMAAAGGGSSDEEKAAAPAPAVESIAEVSNDGEEDSPNDKAPASARKVLTPLPAAEVETVLSWKRGCLTSGHSTPEEIEAFEALSDACAEYQAWMRAEYEANGGVVLVDDEFLKERAEYRQSLKELWKEIKDEINDFDFSGWNISNLRSDFYDDESDQEVEEEVD